MRSGENREGREGTSFIDLIISMAIIAVLFGGIYLVYFSLITSISNIAVRTAASNAIQNEIETIRNLPYESVGIVNGIPSGVIPQYQSVTEGSYTFSLKTRVLNIDDPFDGTVSGNPAPVDTAPADYKLVEITATCPGCEGFAGSNITTTVAPKSLEGATQDGSLFLYVLNANGNGVPNASVEVSNSSVVPSVDFTDTTNASGVLELVGVPTSTQGYHIVAAKGGYSTDQTYAPGASGNPNPVAPDATVVAQTVTSLTLSIDATSTLAVHTSDNRCVAVGNEDFSIQGSKLIGTNPDVYKFSTSSETDAGGNYTFPSLEWDTYTLSESDPSYDLAGTIPLSPYVINPGSSGDFRFVLMPADDPSLLVTAVDSATKAAIPGASITASSGGFSDTETAGHAFISQSDWSGGQYRVISSGINADSPGKVTLLVNASGTYPVSSNDWLTSNSFDLGGSNASLYSISWKPASQPVGTSISFQLAANNDNATWNFVGPDGTESSYFTATGTTPLSLNGNRYVRYKVFLNTTNPSYTPELDSVSIEFSADCVPPAQSLFTALTQGSYTISASAANYAPGSTTVSVGSGWQSAEVQLTHN